MALNDGTHFGGWLSLSGSNGHGLDLPLAPPRRD